MQHHHFGLYARIPALLGLFILALPAARAAEAPQPEADTGAAPSESGEGRTLGADIRAYFTAPVHWDAGDWAWFGGSLAAIGMAHHYDTQVRTHFLKTQSAQQKSSELKDFLPAAAVLGGTWLYAGLIDSSAGRRETWNMLEAAGLSSITVYTLKFAIRRQGPDLTSNPNEWAKGGGRAFPSQHAAAAFAIGTVLAESGNDEYRWLRRLLGYGLGAGSSYLRLKHNAHWLSDTVAGAAIGMASAHFVLNRSDPTSLTAHVQLRAVAGGVLLSYERQFP